MLPAPEPSSENRPEPTGNAPADAADQTLPQALDVSPKMSRLLEDRARRLAEEGILISEGVRVDVLVFHLGEEQYAIELRFLREVLPFPEITPVPCAAAYVAGITNVRGDVVTVLDLAALLNLPAGGAPSDRPFVLLAESPHGPVGFLVDSVGSNRTIEVDRLNRSFSGRDFVLGIEVGYIIVLQIEQLLASGRFEIMEEVG